MTFLFDINRFHGDSGGKSGGWYFDGLGRASNPFHDRTAFFAIFRCEEAEK